MDPAKQLSTLTERQREILRLVCQELTYKNVGEVLVIEESTVKAHMGNIYKKLELDSFTREQRKFRLLQIYCPLLEKSIIIFDSDETVEPEPVSDDIMEMVEEDDFAIIHIQPEQLRRVEVNDPPSRMRIPFSGLGGFLLGIFVSLGIIAIVLFAIWRAGIFGGDESTIDILSTPSVEAATQIPQEEIAVSSPTTEVKEVVIVVTATSPPVTNIPRPTDIPTATIPPTATRNPNTPPGTILEVGQGWRQDSIILSLTDVLFQFSGVSDCTLGLYFEIENRSTSTVIVSAFSDQFSLEDNRGQRWSNTGISVTAGCPSRNDDVGTDIEPGDTFWQGGYHRISVGFDGPLTESAVDWVVVTVRGLLNFDGAQWKVFINN